MHLFIQKRDFDAKYRNLFNSELPSSAELDASPARESFKTDADDQLRSESMMFFHPSPIDLFFDSDEELLIKDDERKSLFDEFDSPTKTNQREKKTHIQKVSLFHQTLPPESLGSFEDLLLHTYPFSNLSIHRRSSEDEVCRSIASRCLGLSSSTGEYLFPVS